MRELIFVIVVAVAIYGFIAGTIEELASERKKKK